LSLDTGSDTTTKKELREYNRMLEETKELEMQ
jgi:hypothetical protein